MSVLPDRIVIQVRRTAELDATSADLTIEAEAAAVFSGKEAFTKARELRVLVEALKTIGVEQSQLKLRSVELNSQSFALIKSSSARYIMVLKNAPLETLPAILGAIAGQKGVALTHLKWNYPDEGETRRRMRREAIAEALEQARGEAASLGVTLLGIYELRDWSSDDTHEDTLCAGGGDGTIHRSRFAPTEVNLGMRLGNATTVSLRLTAEFRVGPLGSADVQALHVQG